MGLTKLALNDDLSEDELTEDHNMDRVKGEDESELSTIASLEVSDIEPELSPALPDSQEDTMTFSFQERLDSSLEKRLRQTEADLLKQTSYSLTLENRISELKRRNSDLEHSISLSGSAQGSYGEETRLRDVISSLKDKLDRERLLTMNLQQLEADRLGFLNTSLGLEYEKLHSNSCDTSSTICHMSLDDTLPEQRTGFSHLANNWARRIGGRDLGSLLGHCESAQIPKKVILASLLAAGIFELVLEEVFPAFLAADSPLLDQYRKHIETQSKQARPPYTQHCLFPRAKITRPGGWNALQRLDFISIKSLVSDKHVKEGIISEKSKWLSNLMLQNLSYFLPLESRDITQRLPRNELEAEIISDMRSTLHHALKVKIELTLSVKRLKYLFFKPGTLFDSEKMELVKSQAGDSALLSGKVRICLLPALFTISDADNKGGVGEEPSLMANHSKALTEVMDKDDTFLVLVEKAVVFL